MARGGVWHNKYKIREQESPDDFSSECAHLTGHIELVASDVEWLSEQVTAGNAKPRLRLFGVWQDSTDNRRWLSLSALPFRARKKR